jgi:uncharacterized lipoprotein YddW (UPF0748 family)
MKRNGVLVLVIALFCVAAALIPYVFTSKSVKEAFNSASFSIPEGETERAGEKGETFAVWIASVYNLNYPTKHNMTSDELASEAAEICEKCVSLGLNTVYLQVRPSADSLYKSEIFPWSDVLTGIQGNDPGCDPLELFINEAKKKDIRVHAWINPYRVTVGSLKYPKTDLDSLAENHPARKHPEWVVRYGGALYFNPGIPEVRRLIIDGTIEIADKYDIAGVHMDDYFYPYPIEHDGKTLEFDDSAQYERYGGGKTLENWRRDCVNELVKGLYTSLKIVNQRLEFGISPFGIWANDDGFNGGSATEASTEGYYDLFADATAWIDGGYIDYICPQIYWSFESEKTPFKNVYEWWSETVKGTCVKLIPGIAAYRLYETETPGWDRITQVSEQLRYVREKANASGTACYGYEQLAAESDAVRMCAAEIKAWKNE